MTTQLTSIFLFCLQLDVTDFYDDDYNLDSDSDADEDLGEEGDDNDSGNCGS